ncbi:MAG: DUF4192 domain-containing protein [Specibacter sp.]
MNEKIRLTTTADLLAMFAHNLGMTPTESFVLVAMRGNRLAATLRVDVPAGHPVGGFASMVAGYLMNDREADGAMFAVYTDTDGSQPYREHVEAIELELLAAGIAVRDILLVTGAGWRSYSATDEELSPLASITDSAANAAMIFAGSNLEAGKAQDRKFTGAPGNAAAIAVLASGFTDVDALDISAPVMREARGAWSKALGTTPDTARACLLVAYIQNVNLRDRLMADLFNTDERDFGNVLIGDTTTRPTWDRVEQGEALALELLSQTPQEFRAPLYAILGFISWYMGRSSRALDYMEKALDAEPGYRLADLFKQLLEYGHLPAVVTNRDTAYPGAAH